MLPVIPRRFFEPQASILPAIGARRAKIAMLNGCVMPLLFGDVNEATVRVLRRNGCEVVFPKDQICCGALNTHNGESVAAKMMARRNIDAFLEAGVDAVVVNAAGCGSYMKEWPRLSEKVKDITEFLVELGPVAARQPLNVRIAYHDACHLAHEQRIRSQPRALLAAIPGVQLTDIPDGDTCCGSAGIYNLVEPETARQLGDRKAGCIAAVKPDVIASANPGCTLQIAAAGRRLGREWTILHPMEILDASIRGTRF
jgi:glycolate oxidase iron-sulfur subunit